MWNLREMPSCAVTAAPTPSVVAVSFKDSLSMADAAISLLRRCALPASIVLAALAYSFGLHGPLLFDDRSNLLPVAAWLEGRTDGFSVLFGNASGHFGRPVSVLSFMLNAALLGPGAWGLKLGNLLIHLVNGVLVFLLFQNLIHSDAPTRDRSTKSWLPWLGASIWLLHPLLASTVLYVVQRMAMLSALFTLLALIAYVRGRMALVEGRRRNGIALLGVLVPLCTVLAALSKENGVLAPALCAVIELFAFQPTQGRRRAMLSRAFIAVALVLPMLIALGLTVAGHPSIVAGYENRAFSLTERLLTQPRALWSYVGALLLPSGPRMGIYHDDYLVSHGWLDPPTTIAAIVAWLAVLAAAWHWRKAIPGFALGVGLFLVGHALESTVFPLILYFEHRNYFPAVGLIWAVLSLAEFAASKARARLPNASPLLTAAACALVAVLALSTAARAGIWSSHHSIMQQALIHHPDSRWLRQDLIAQAMGMQPPDLAAVRLHADHLLASADSSTRRLGALERILVDCNAGADADPDVVHTAFDGRPEPIEADLLAVFILLGSRLQNDACPGLPSDAAATQLSALLDRSSLPQSSASLRALRFEAAKLYASANPAAALTQAELARMNDANDPQVAAFIVDLTRRTDPGISHDPPRTGQDHP